MYENIQDPKKKKQPQKQIEEPEKSQIYTLYINHDSLEENTQLLETALQDLHNFHQDHPKHLPIFLTINLKSYLKDYNINFPSLLQKIETQLKTSLSLQNLFLPKNLLKTHASLLTAVKNDNYPKIQQLLGKFIVLLDPELFSQEDPNQQELLDFYNNYSQNVENSLMFPTLDGRLILVNFQTFAEFLEQNQVQNQIFFNMPGDLYESDYYYLQEEAQNIIKEAQKQNFITRVYTINDEEFYEYYKNQKVNFICTDAVFYNLFAKPFF
ncbi:PLC-like phosphodiesterase, TIM beta/alpha-barrel domain [Pseudocohnilembus persalinus]|uniref:PLC-like phosphodiesterase, TIM beta/alpha-barrel domain n=1 Tax=Pseudocohnilembus persalinus TaxID=266149 RepID=A0A0V0QCL0_PSEPJ|nr:PLC-like phosphodiesterase, TIM beta/alpha-barrel domain [Pseudocohnilembus persalinus]|eukprot:KRW99847.1 PLC-like phosphodiesterase, TIM beta/alpha-barrel domain [Pseudocohnilembus persalinus]